MHSPLYLLCMYWSLCFICCVDTSGFAFSIGPFPAQSSYTRFCMIQDEHGVKIWPSSRIYFGGTIPSERLIGSPYS
ncbi:hypothetical protein EDD22DRAFT_930329 [Suillus occidentalis]|nr:hypothetical protein EDD22DRAFT_930329 [Suillus occidentalis]